MTEPAPSLPFYSPGVQSLIPLFYVAWADKVLSPSEVNFLKHRVSELNLLDEQEQEVIDAWSNPAQPPSRELFKHWEIELRKVARELDPASRASLVDLGLEMARRSARRVEGADQLKWSMPEVRRALEELEERLGLIREETYRSIFQEQDKPEVESPVKEDFPFDVTAMTRFLDGSYADIRRRVQLVLNDPAFRYPNLRIKEAYRAQVLRWCRLLADQGLGALAFPREYGGQDDMGAYATVFETLGYHDLSLAIKFGVQFGLFGGSIQWLGTKRHHEKYLSQVGTLALPGCFAMTETGHGSNVRGLETTGTYDPESDEFIIHSPNFEAGKEYIGNALHSQLASVFVQLIVAGENHGVHAILVPLRNVSGALLPGIQVEDNGYKLGLNGVDNGRIWFDEVRVPRENLLNRFGDVDEHGQYNSSISDPSKRFFTMLGTLVGGRVCVPRTGLSATKSGISIAIKYALKRRQFGSSYTEPETLLLDYPSHRRRLMPLLAKTYALHFALQHLTDFYLKRDDSNIREIETLAAGLKAYSTWFTTQALQECREACGGKGYLAENRFADLKADTDIFTTFEGDNTVLMQLVARGVLTRFKKEFSEEGVMGVLRYLGGNIATNIRERNPIMVRRTDREHLLDADFHQRAFEFREQRLLYSVSQRLRSKIKNGMKAYEAYLDCQTHLLTLAEAFVERYVLHKFYESIAAAPTELQPVLTQLCQLYALHTIEQHKGWYLEKDYIESNKSRAIRRLVDAHCLEIRAYALPLVESFAIPPALLGAAIV